MKKVILTGRLAKEFGTEFELDVSNPAEAIRALCYQLPEFEVRLRQGQYKIKKLGKKDSYVSLDGLHVSFGKTDGIKIYPVAAGSKNKGLGKLILGVALIGAAFFFAPAAAAGGMSANIIGNVTYGYLAQTGALIALGGISALLTPQIKDSSEERKTSFTLDSTGNKTEQGSYIPVVFGEVFTGSVVVSAGVTAEELT